MTRVEIYNELEKIEDIYCDAELKGHEWSPIERATLEKMLPLLERILYALDELELASVDFMKEQIECN